MCYYTKCSLIDRLSIVVLWIIIYLIYSIIVWYIVLYYVFSIAVFYSLYVVQCTLYNVQCTMYNVHCAMYVSHFGGCTTYNMCGLYVIVRGLYLAVRDICLLRATSVYKLRNEFIYLHKKRNNWGQWSRFY